MTDSLADRFAEIRARIDRAAADAGRDPASVTLVAVTKTFPASVVSAAAELGQRVFGENRVQEAMAKYAPLRAAIPDLELHLIGALQTNKVREAIATFDVIETVDRDKLARALAKEMAASGQRRRCFIQVNTGEEPQKAGVLPTAAEGLIRLARDELGLPVEGLMCIPPFDDDPAPHFARLAELAARYGLARLSMGMSADFETAIRFGATHVRVGTALFGERPRAEALASLAAGR